MAKRLWSGLHKAQTVLIVLVWTLIQMVVACRGQGCSHDAGSCVTMQRFKRHGGRGYVAGQQSCHGHPGCWLHLGLRGGSANGTPTPIRAYRVESDSEQFDARRRGGTSPYAPSPSRGTAGDEADKAYHELIAKRAGLMREVDTMTVRGLQLTNRLEKDKVAAARSQQFSTEARSRADDLWDEVKKREAAAAAAAALVVTAKNEAAEAAKAAQAAEHEANNLRNSVANVEAEIKLVLQEGKEANDKLKVTMDEFHFLLLNAKNNAMNTT